MKRTVYAGEHSTVVKEAKEGEHQDHTEPHHLDRRADERARERRNRSWLAGRGSDKSPLSTAARVRSATSHGATTGLSRHHQQPDEDLNSQAHLTSPEKARRRAKR